MPPAVDIQGILDAVAHWLPKCAIACLVLTAAVCLATWISMRTRLLWRGWLSALSPAAKTLCLLATCFAAWMSGAKQVGGRSGASDATTIRHEIEAPCTIPLATIGESNLVAITDFAACPANQTLAFEATWESNLFDYTASRDLFLLQSTNLLEQRWAPLGAYTMPSDTNAYAFTVAEADVDAAMRPLFLDAFSGGMAFYRLGIDFDSDGDGLAYGWETGYGFDPLSAAGSDGAFGDPDNDGLANILEQELWTDPRVADYFYVSGHGSHSNGEIQGGFTAANAMGYWGRDLDVVVIAGCSVLDINDYNGNYDGVDHSRSPGKAWERTGPTNLLGYAYIAPGDGGGAPARIMQSWVANRGTLGDVGAWMKANADNHAWNACAIVKGEKYCFFTRKWFAVKIVEKPKGEW